MMSVDSPADIRRGNVVQTAPKGPVPTTKQDWTSRAGAQRLAKRIEAYWRAKGATVTCTTMAEGVLNSPDVAHHVVRSDMVNGLPRGWPA